jgi:hypothetical protein
MKLVPGKLYKVIQSIEMIPAYYSISDTVKNIKRETVLMFVGKKEGVSERYEQVFLHDGKIVVANFYKVDKEPELFFEEVEL